MREPRIYGWTIGNKEYDSKYNKKDYRSKYYEKNWVTPWLNEVVRISNDLNKPLYEVMAMKRGDKEEHMPKRLFKFFPFNTNSLKCIEQNKVYMSSPENFNDPFECYVYVKKEDFTRQYILDYIEENHLVKKNLVDGKMYDRIKNSSCDRYKYFASDMLQPSTYEKVMEEVFMYKEHKTIQDLWYDAHKKYNETIKSIRETNIRISSFSAFKEENFLAATEMWGHYAQNHKGFCVEYDLSGEISNREISSLIEGSLIKCTYVNKTVPLANSTFYKKATNKPFTKWQRIQFQKSIYMSALKKSSAWSYEKEWRLVLPQEFFAEENFLVDFYPIKVIYLGWKMSDDDKEYMYRLAQRKNIRICCMDCLDEYYNLDYREIVPQEYFAEKEVLKKLKKYREDLKDKIGVEQIRSNGL